jgi:hypothetical protein
MNKPSLCNQSWGEKNFRFKYHFDYQKYNHQID